jgi:hypothetical protein
MKKTYEIPKLMVHGTVEEMTKAIPPSSAQDSYILGGTTIDDGTGSQDAVIYGV